MAKKSKTIEYKVCDFCEVETEAVGVSNPSGKDVCVKHFNAFKEEVRLPKEFGSEMSGKRVIVDPGYDAKMVIKYTKEK